MALDATLRRRTLTEPLLIGITGHRNLRADEVPALREAVRDFLLALRTQCPTLELTVVSSLAAGGDQLVAEEALALGAKVAAVLPMVRTELDPRQLGPWDRRCFQTHSS